jgi:hypothetical protein
MDAHERESENHAKSVYLRYFVLNAVVTDGLESPSYGLSNLRQLG